MAIVQNYLPGDPLLIDKIVYELKSQGIFDQFRKECIADVDTKPAYQNLRQRVEGSVNGFLNKQKWSSDMNKNHLREMLRKNIYESGFLETGVERIVDQVVNPKINSIFLPKVTEVVYKFLGVEKPTTDKKENSQSIFNDENLLPTDLEAVSPESEKRFDFSNDSRNIDDKVDEDESPPFEPLEDKVVFIPPEENSVDSHMSGFSGLMSHDSNHSQEFSKPIQIEITTQDSMLSKQSSEGRLSIVMSDDNETKMEICEDSLQKTATSNDTKLKDFYIAPDSVTNPINSSKKLENKQEDKSKSNKSHDKHKSRHDKSERKDDKEKKNDKDRKEHKRSSRDKGRDKDRKDLKNGSNKNGKDSKNDKESKSDNKNDKDSKFDNKNEKDKNKSSSSSSNRHNVSSNIKEKEKSSSKKDSSSSKDRGDNKDRSKSTNSRDKDIKKDEKIKSDCKSNSKHDSKSIKGKKDDKHRSDRHRSSSKNRDKNKKDSKKDKKDKKDDHFSSKKKSERRSTDRDSNDGQSGLKGSSSSFDSYTSSQTQNKVQESSNSNSNNGSADSGNSDSAEEFTSNTPMTSLTKEIIENVTVDNLVAPVTVPALKLIKPKFASNIHEAKRLMKIRKQLTLLEKQNILDLSQMLTKKINENNNLKSQNDKIENKTNNTMNSSSPYNNNYTVKQNNSVLTISPAKVNKELTAEPLSPPLKSSVVSAATWDALEAKLHETIDYSTYYDVPETEEISLNYNKDDCLYLKLDSNERFRRYMKFIEEYTTNLQNIINQHSVNKVENKWLHVGNISNTNRNLKRKLNDCHSDLKNNNKKIKTHHVEVHENFSLPLSPAESDNSIDKKSDTSESSYKSFKKTETELLERVKKTMRASTNTQRYSSEDLYKPRLIFGGSRRRTGRNLELD